MAVVNATINKKTKDNMNDYDDLAIYKLLNRTTCKDSVLIRRVLKSKLSLMPLQTKTNN